MKISHLSDFVLLRHMTFDPFALLFAPIIHNRASIHHAKEVEELRLIKNDWRGLAASLLERVTGRFVVRRSVLIIGVTREIALYELKRAGIYKPIAILPNGIDEFQVDILGDLRDDYCINGAFVCGSFNPWHGLDLLLETVQINHMNLCAENFCIHLIGSLSKEQIRNIKTDAFLSRIFVCHGNLKADRMRSVLEKCDFAIGSLAMFRQNLSEGATFKVREMLALGLPVISGHVDTALPESFPFYQFRDRVDLKDIIEFGQMSKEFARHEIREAALPFIVKSNFMRKVAQELDKLQ